MKAWVLAACCLMEGPSLIGQVTCQIRAQKTVDEAKRAALLGDRTKVAVLLGQADRECGTDPNVRKSIGQVYELAGDPVRAAPYLRDRTGAQAPTAVATIAKKGYVREKYALVVGIGQFHKKSIRSLRYAAKDATDFAAVLTDPAAGRFPPENVTLLVDEQATTQEIRRAIGKVVTKAYPEDLVVLYFSTHGSNPGMDRSKIAAGYLITHDTEPDALYATGYGMDELANVLRQKLKAERIITILDTCYSGDTTRILGSKALEIESIPESTFSRIAQGTGSVVITSSTEREMSWESDEKENSFFTSYLIEAMRSRSGLGTIAQIYTDIQRKIPVAVQEYTRRKGLGDPKRGATQTPVIYPSSGIPDIVPGTPLQ